MKGIPTTKIHPKKKARRRAVKPKVKVPEQKVPDWQLERWSKKVVAFHKRLRRRFGIPLDVLVPVSGITRQGWRKFELGSKRGPLFSTILRAAYALPQRSWSIVITPEGSGPEVDAIGSRSESAGAMS